MEMTEHSDSIYGGDAQYNDDYIREKYGMYESPVDMTDSEPQNLSKVMKSSPPSPPKNTIDNSEHEYDIPSSTTPSQSDLRSPNRCNWKLITLIIVLIVCFLSSAGIMVYFFTFHGNIKIM